MGKIKVFHFHNGSGGGVLTVIRNLLQYSQSDQIENHVIYTINRDKYKKFDVPKLEGASTEQVFYYSPKWNFYYTCRQLANLLPDDNAVIVAHDWLELGMASYLGSKNPIVQILHGDFEYYYELALKHFNNIDRFICVSDVIANELKSRITIDKTSIHYLPFPAKDFYFTQKNFNRICCIYFVSHLLDDRKNFAFIPKFDSFLIKNGIEIDWIIIGDGYSQDQIFDIWTQYNPDRIVLKNQISNDQINDYLKAANFMILPSFSEGFPVSLVEAMKSGLIPIISSWRGAVSKLVIEGVSGFYINPFEPEFAAQKMAQIFINKTDLELISQKGSLLANKMFDPTLNTLEYEKIFVDALLNKKIKYKVKTYGSRLDHRWIPNFLVKTIRSIVK